MTSIRNILKIITIWLTWVCFLVYKLFHSKKPDYSKILVVYLSGIGDTVCLTPFFQRLLSSFPSARIWCCLPKNLVDLQRSFCEFDGYISHEHYWKSVKQIRHEKFDLILIPGWLLKNSIISILSLPGSIYGYVNEHTFSNQYLNTFIIEGSSRFFHKRIINTRHCHLTERANPILEEFGLQSIVSSELDFKRIYHSAGYVVIHAGASFKGRRWQPENYRLVLDHIIENKLGIRVFLIGDNGDRALNQKLSEGYSKEVVEDLSGKLSLLETKDLIKEAKLFIGSDSGPMHIAYFCGIPTIAIMGPNSPQVSGPLGRNSRFIYKELICSGCNQRSCSNKYICINAVDSLDVQLLVKELSNAEE